VFSAVLLIAIVFAVAPIVAYLPLASMAAILFLVAWGLFDFAAMRAIARTSRNETAVLAVTVAATLLLNLEVAILAGVALSLVVYLARTSRPNMRAVLPDPAHPARKFVEREPGMVECPQAKFLRIEGSVYFGAVDHVAGRLDALRAYAPEQKHLVVMSKGINFVDVAGAELLAHEARQRRADGGGLYFYGMRQGMREALERGGQLEEIGRENVFVAKREMVTDVFERLDRSICARCTARIFEECAGVPRAQG
jgi:SulP family sulfate permease